MENKKIEIWMEGYSATGEHSDANKIYESATAIDFDSAILEYMQSNSRHGIDERTSQTGEKYYSIWACRLFDNEADARKSFG